MLQNLGVVDFYYQAFGQIDMIYQSYPLKVLNKCDYRYDTPDARLHHCLDHHHFVLIYSSAHHPHMLVLVHLDVEVPSMSLPLLLPWCSHARTKV
jgi:hypothetical protein